MHINGTRQVRERDCILLHDPLLSIDKPPLLVHPSSGSCYLQPNMEHVDDATFKKIFALNLWRELHTNPTAAQVSELTLGLGLNPVSV